MFRLVTLVIIAHIGSTLTSAGRTSQPRLQFTLSELVHNGRLLTLPIVAEDLHFLLPDEDGRRLYVAMKNNLLSTSLDDITQNPQKLYWPPSPDRVQDCLMAGKDRELECANFLRVLQPYNKTHLYVCGTGAFNPRCAFIPTNVFHQSEKQTLSYEQTESGKGKCPYDPFQKTASAIIDGELYAGITSDFMSRDSAFFRSLGNRHVIRTEQYDSTWLQDAQFLRVASMAETDNPEDDKVYFFFTERAQEAEGAAGKVLYSRVARVCKNDIGGQRSLVNKWSTFQKARMVCSVPGPNGIQTHFDQLQDIFILHEKDKKNPLIYGLFTTSSDVLNGSAVCVYRMQDVVRAFKGNFLHKEGPQYKWTGFNGKMPYPRPGTCPSSTYGSYSSTREYPDDVIFFSRTHPLLQENVLPLGERPLLVRVGVHYKFSKLLVDRVEAVDGTYDVLFIGTDSGLVLKSIHLPREDGLSQEVTLEQLQVFKHKSPVTAMTISKKKQWLYVGSSEGVSQLALFKCELYGQACAECCLARDPYCTWDGHACSPYMPIARRRNARQVGQDEGPLTQCVRQGAGLQVEAEQRVIMVAEGNSTFLECLPKSRRAAITWYKQAGKNSPELHQVTSGDQLVLIEQGVLIRRAEAAHSGVYHCQLEEHGFHWTAVTVRLSVWTPSSPAHISWSNPTNHNLLLPSGSIQPWYEDVMAVIHPNNLEQHCQDLGYRPPRKNRHRHGVKKPSTNHDKEQQKGGGPKGERHKHGGRGEGQRGGGRNSRSKPQQRAPRSA
ncbi:sema domain, immunoglobulin domain (Ig), short basic domain, secreted, (semaphorin) 3H [Aplochiton taeniatus]